MSHVMELITSAGARVAILTQAECDVRIRRVLNGEWTCKITYPVPPGEDKVEHFDLFKVRGRVMNVDDSTDYTTFVLDRPSFEHRGDGTVVLTVEGEHISVDKLRTEVVEASYDFQDVTPTYALTKILSHSSAYTVGSVTATKPVTIRVSWETVQSALCKLVEACGGEYDVDEVNSEIDLLTALGSTTKYIHVRPGRNLRAIRRTRYSSDVVNKLFGVGGGDPPATMAGARHTVVSMVGAVLTVDHNRLVPENDCWNPVDANVRFGISVVTGAAAGTWREISDCAHGATQDTVTLTSTIASLAAGD